MADKRQIAGVEIKTFNTAKIYLSTNELLWTSIQVDDINIRNQNEYTVLPKNYNCKM